MTDIRSQALACRDAAHAVAALSSAAKAQLLNDMAAQLLADQRRSWRQRAGP
jgi:hypothetical protein